MTPGKRIFDLVLTLALLVPLGLVMSVVTLVLLATQGRPILYGAERMRHRAGSSGARASTSFRSSSTSWRAT